MQPFIALKKQDDLASWQDFVRNRLMVSAVFLVAAVISNIALKFEALFPLLILAIVEFAESLVYKYMVSSRIMHRINYIPFVTDILFVVLFIYLMGGVRTAFFIAYIWPVIVASRLEGKRKLSFFAGFSAFLFLVLLLSQRFGLLPPWIVMNEKSALLFFTVIGLPYLGFMSYLMWSEGVRTGGVEKELKESEEKFRNLVEASPNIVAILQDSVIKYVNKTAERLLGYSEKELMSGNFSVPAMMAGEGPAMFLERSERVLRGEDVPRYNVSLTRKDGTSMNAIVHNGLITYNGKPAVEAVFVDITSQEKLVKAIYRMSRTDHLTGFYNSRQMDPMLEAEIKRSERYGRPLSLFYIDMDNFKRCNDDHGHQFGDRVLQRFGRLVEKEIRTGIDMIFRYGGDEFVLLLPETDTDNAAVLAERLRVRIKEGLFAESGVTISIGIAQYSRGCDLIKLADKAMYEAKKCGRDAVYVSGKGLFSPALGSGG